MSPRDKGRRTIGCWIEWTPAGRGRLCFTWNGRLHRITTDYGRKDERELLRVRNLIGAEIRAGVFVPERRFPSVFAPKVRIEPLGTAPLLPEVIEKWIAEKLLRRVRTSRVREYRGHLRNYLAIGPLARLMLERVGLAEMQAFQLWLVSAAGEQKKGISEKTAANVIRGTLQALIRDRGTPEQLVAVRSLTWERYAPTRRVDVFTEEERDRLLGWFRANRPLPEYVSVALRFQGITPSEVRGLRVGDFDRATSSVRIERAEDRGEIVATKAQNRVRVVDLPSILGERLRVLAGACGPEERLIRGIRTERALIYQFRRAQLAIGCRFRSIYTAKHTYATWALLAGDAAADVARHLGISEATLIKHYAAQVREGRRIRAERGSETPRKTPRRGPA